MSSFFSFSRAAITLVIECSDFNLSEHECCDGTARKKFESTMSDVSFLFIDRSLFLSSGLAVLEGCNRENVMDILMVNGGGL